MLIYPAIDIMDGGCVRLRQGRFDERTDYAQDPAEALAGFAAAGTQWAHIVDLDGARAGQPAQHELIGRLARDAAIAVQVAGGVRDRDDVARLLDVGAARVVIGSLAVRDPAAVAAMIAEFGPAAIVLALDVNHADGDYRVATAGWTQSSALSLWDAAARIPAARHLLVTDIARDGMLAGPNIALMHAIRERLPDMAAQASGGVTTLADLPALAATGASAAIVGKALWEGRFELSEAIAHARR